MSVIHIESVEQFKQEVLEFDGVSIVDFRAERCGPCRMLWPIMEDLAEDNTANDKVKIVKVNVEEHRALAETFQVSSIPAVFIVQGGKAVDAIIGANPKEIYQNKINALLDTASAQKVA